MSTPPSSPPQSILRPSSIKISQSDYYKLTYIFLFKVFRSLHANKYVEACHVCNNLYAVISKVRSVKPTNWPRKKFAISLSVDISRIFKMFFCIQTSFDCKLARSNVIDWTWIMSNSICFTLEFSLFASHSTYLVVDISMQILVQYN